MRKGWYLTCNALGFYCSMWPGLQPLFLMTGAKTADPGQVRGLGAPRRAGRSAAGGADGELRGVRPDGPRCQGSSQGDIDGGVFFMCGVLWLRRCPRFYHSYSWCCCGTWGRGGGGSASCVFRARYRVDMSFIFWTCLQRAGTVADPGCHGRL